MSHDRPTRGSSSDEIARGRLRRTAPLVGLTARTAGEAVVVALRHKTTGADTTEFHVRTAERYAELLGRSKGALMKAGQMISFVSAGPAVPSQFQTVYQATLARLRDDAPPMAPELARATLERELGRRTEAVFAEFDWEPLAAASIGQVHAARLSDGRAVAVKIQYPGVAEAIGSDIKNGELVTTFLRLIMGLSPRRVRVDLRAFAAEIVARVSEELDYRLEASSQAEFAALYRGHPFIHVPEVIDELCTDRILTQELAEGRSWEQALEAERALRDSWGEAIHRFTYGSLNRFSLINADPHPGNFVFHDDGSVRFLDFGCVRRFSPERVRAMNAPATACINGDVLGTWHAAAEMGFYKSSDPVTPEEVYEFWRLPFEMYWGEQPFTITPERAAVWIERRYSPIGPSAKAIQYTATSADWAMMMRLELGVVSVLAGLRATSDWRSIHDEWSDAKPVTAMGKVEHAFFAEREPADQHA